jgi:serine/threonine protein kinase
VDDERPITVTSVRTVTNDGEPVTSAEDLEPGMQFGRYVIKEVLGEGGMGVVYAAFDPTLNRKIAIKVLRVSNGMGDIDTRSARMRMIREAQAMAMCGHPNLVQVFDVGTYSDDVFIAMEFVEGITLREWLETHDPKDWETILAKYLDAARGLGAAHFRHLIHRDFKPENVMVDQGGHVRVMDFGLARHVGSGDSETTMETPAVMARPLTQTGMIMGTPAYMAPEQFLADATDERTDQFAFCIALFEALYGYRPFGGDTMKALAKSVMRGEIQLPPRKHPVPDHILTGLLTGLQTESEDRHDNMNMLIDSLTVKPDTAGQGVPWVLYGTAFAVAMTGVILYWITAQRLNEPPPPSPTQQTRVVSPPTTPTRVDPVIPSITQGVITDGQMDGRERLEEGEGREGALDRHDPVRSTYGSLHLGHGHELGLPGSQLCGWHGDQVRSRGQSQNRDPRSP